MKPTQRLACLLATVFTVSAASAQLAEEYRQWTNTAGKQIEATLVAVDAVARSVKIKMKDGKEYDVPIASLSAGCTSHDCGKEISAFVGL